MKPAITSLAIAAIAASATPAFAITPVQGYVAAGAFIQVGDAIIESRSIDAQTLVVPNTIAVRASVLTDGPEPDTLYSVRSSVSATWNSARAGTIDLSWGWGSPGGYPNEQLNLRTLAPEFLGRRDNWAYEFTTGAQAQVFTLDWQTDFSGTNPFGLFNLLGSGGMPTFLGTDSPFGMDGSGTVSLALTPNTTYRLGIFNNGNRVGPDQVVNGQMEAAMRWTITNATPAIPEPATWAMLIIGFGFVGAALRRSAARATA
jgi:hypothetical protein